MAWAVPQHSKTSVDKSGRLYIDGTATQPARDQALGVINNWRSSHGFPLNTMQVALRRYAGQVCKGPLIAQRLKRLASIEAKLQRFSGTRLSQMQDIGGARAVVPMVNDVRAVVTAFRNSDLKHTLLTFDDYISVPQASGYRGCHLIYRYNSDKNQTYNGLKIELQIRSRLQHAWATAVETVAMLTRQGLKSSKGAPEWLRFFALMGSVIAAREGTSLVPGTGSDIAAIRRELRQLDAKLGVVEKLKAYSFALRHIDAGLQPAANVGFFLLKVDARTQTLTVQGFRPRDLQSATEAYDELERNTHTDPALDAVLVSVDSLAALRRAYPNYFADTRIFVKVVSLALRG